MGAGICRCRSTLCIPWPSSRRGPCKRRSRSRGASASRCRRRPSLPSPGSIGRQGFSPCARGRWRGGAALGTGAALAIALTGAAALGVGDEAGALPPEPPCRKTAAPAATPSTASPATIKPVFDLLSTGSGPVVAVLPSVVLGDVRTGVVSGASSVGAVRTRSEGDVVRALATLGIPSARSNAAQKSRARGKRSSGFTASAFSNTASTASGTAAPSVRGVGRRVGCPQRSRAGRGRPRRARSFP